MASGNPVSAAYDEMFPEPVDRDFGGGFDSGVSNGVSSGVSSGTKGGMAMGSDPSPSYSSLGSNIGLAASMATGITGLGTLGAIGGSLADAYTMDQIAEQQGLPSLTVGQVARGVLADVVPFSQSLLGMPTHQDFYQQNYLDKIGGFLQPSNMYSSLENDPYGFNDPYAPSNSWDTDMANAASNYGAQNGTFGGWGGYKGQANIGPGADYESDSEPSDDFGGWGGYSGDKNDGPGADAEGEGW